MRCMRSVSRQGDEEGAFSEADYILLTFRPSNLYLVFPNHLQPPTSKAITSDDKKKKKEKHNNVFFPSHPVKHQERSMSQTDLWKGLCKILVLVERNTVVTDSFFSILIPSI